MRLPQLAQSLEAGELTFVPFPDPTPSDIETLTHKIAHRLTAVVERLCADECETEAVLERTAASLREALATAVAPPIPKLGLDLLGLDHTATGTPLCAKVAGFSLHAARVIDAHDRDGLEKLCRYGLRAPLSQERLSQREDGRVVYHLRRPWPNAQGATCLVLDPIEFLRRLAALAPAPYANLVRYHGVFASRSRWRALLPEPPGKDADPNAPARSHLEPENQLDDCRVQAPAASPALQREVCTRRRRSLPWAQLLRRVFFLDALTCPRCSSSMLVLALLSEPEVVRKILLHLELDADVPPPAPAVHNDEPLFDDDIPAPARPPP